MCQLLGMNSLKPSSPRFSLAGFLRRGGETDEHSDGWGIAYYEDGECRILVDAAPAASSPVTGIVQKRRIRSRNVVAHIRKATQGRVALANCHPFRRSLWGKEWVFAHNGNVEVSRLNLAANSRFAPVGETDSERVFCALMQALDSAFADYPGLPILTNFLAESSAQIALHGNLNFVLSDGEVMFARRATELHYVRRTYPFGRARLVDAPLTIDFSQHNHLDDRIVIVATRPLTDEAWTPLPVAKIVAFANGDMVHQGHTQTLTYAV